MHAGATRRPLNDLLSLARTRAANNLAHDECLSAADVQELLHQITHFALGESTATGASSPDWATMVVPARFVDTLRSAVLDAVAQGEVRIDARDLAIALRTMDLIGKSGHACSPGDFAHHLASSDSVNSVVEIAHDMRSPLTSILFLVDTLRRAQSGPVTPVQERQLGLIYGAALGLNTLASDVIDAVRGGHRLIDGAPVPFSISEVVMGVCDTVRPISEEKGLPIELALLAVDGRLGYPAALGRVLLNLLTNALKYTNDGCVAMGCSEVSECRVLFWVQDTGEGIPQHVMSMLFDGFRPSASGIRFSNAGLGLAICQSFLTSMGTKLSVESGREKGTRFSFEIDLPRA